MNDKLMEQGAQAMLRLNAARKAHRQAMVDRVQPVLDALAKEPAFIALEVEVKAAEDEMNRITALAIENITSSIGNNIINIAQTLNKIQRTRESN